MTVHRYLDLSTAHLDERCGLAMADGDSLVDDPDEEGPCYIQVSSPGDGEVYGHLLGVVKPQKEWPQCINDCLRRAIKLKCLYIRFDSLAEIDPALPTYEW